MRHPPGFLPENITLKLFPPSFRLPCLPLHLEKRLENGLHFSFVNKAG
jgi:hypothetical protein